jgi:class 3 adenylate cyclase
LTLFDGKGPRNRRLRGFLRKRAQTAAPARAALDRAHGGRLFCRRAVVFTDCADFTVRTLRDGILHFLMVFEAAAAGTAAVVRRTRGEVLKVDADSLLILYPSVAAACRGVDAIEAFLRRFNAARPRGEQARFSYGVGFGDVLDLDGDAFGAEVNLASKIGEDLARPGEVLLTPGAADALSPVERARLVRHAAIRFDDRRVLVQRLRPRARR